MISAENERLLNTLYDDLGPREMLLGMANRAAWHSRADWHSYPARCVHDSHANALSAFAKLFPKEDS